MATLNIKIFPEEKLDMMKVIAHYANKPISVSQLAKLAKQNPNRARYVIDELLQEGKIEKILVKSFNDRYKRFCYKMK